MDLEKTLKVGDKLLCKNSLVEYNYGALTSTSRLICGDGHHIRITDVGWRDFVVENNEGESTIVKFCDYEIYFYTDKELRKLKLEKIENR